MNVPALLLIMLGKQLGSLADQRRLRMSQMFLTLHFFLLVIDLVTYYVLCMATTIIHASISTSKHRNMQVVDAPSCSK